eukprot:gene7928-10725_t
MDVMLRFCICLLAPMAYALDNGAAPTPPLGWQSWNGFGMNFNATLFKEQAVAMKNNGLLAAGYTLISAGGSTYPHQGIPPWNTTNETKQRRNVIVRNTTGYYQIDPARFPGPGSTPDCLNATTLIACLANHSTAEECGCANGNDGMAELSREIRQMGFSWGSYSNEGGCEVADCNTTAMNASRYRDFVDQDAELMLDYWQSDYVMVDSVGTYSGAPDRPYPKSDQRWWEWSKTVLTLWADVIKKRSKPGATASWSFGYLRDADRGLCVGCSMFWGSDCADDAVKMQNGSGYGVGMQASDSNAPAIHFPKDHNAAACGGPCPSNGGCGSHDQQWNYSAAGAGASSKMLVRSDGACLDILSPNNQVTARHGGKWCKTATPTMQWELGSSMQIGGGVTFSQLKSVGAPGTCLTAGAAVQYELDPWCAENNNMWRSSTDTLQVWPRVLVEIDSLVGLGHVSGPGHWGFAVRTLRGPARISLRISLCLRPDAIVDIAMIINLG